MSTLKSVMGPIFSHQCEYALQAVLFLALRPEDEMTPIRALAIQLDIPYHFLAKILQDLTRKGLLVSSKGRRGGFALPSASREGNLFHVVSAVDGEKFMRSCVIGVSECSDRTPCALHSVWSRLRDEIYGMLVCKSIFQVAHDFEIQRRRGEVSEACYKPISE